MSALHNQPEYRVSELAGYIKRTVEDQFGFVRVRGEISKCGVNASSGHAYITLKDEGAVLESVCWRGTLSKLAHKPEVGMEVIASGRLTTYPGRSQYQLIIEALVPAGAGALMAMLEARKKALAAEGLFDAARKKPLPLLPEVIGMITSPTGSVIRDMLHRIADRFPRHVLLWPVAVQGSGAAEQIAAAIDGFNQFPHPSGLPRPDVIIVARGGGSVEDLWPFNEEIVVRAAASSRIPLISAVGHETDTTLIDYAADLRAPTPTAAAEHAVPVRREWMANIQEYGASLIRALMHKVTLQEERLQRQHAALTRFPQRLDEAQQRLDDLAERLARAPQQMMHLKRAHWLQCSAALQPAMLRERMQQSVQQLQASELRMHHAANRRITAHMHMLSMQAAKLALLDVRHVLSRGFALVRDARGKLVTSAAAAAQHAPASLEFFDDVTVLAGSSAPRSPRGKAKKATTQESLF